MKYLLPLFLLLAACGTRQITFHPRMEEKYKKYAEGYVVDASRYNIGINTSNLIIKTSDLKGAVLGFCSSGTIVGQQGLYATEEAIKTIEINSNYWDDMDEISRYALIYHELHHCLRKAKHDDESVLFNNWKVRKIMSTYSYLFRGSYMNILYATYWDGLVENMFTGKDQKYLTHEEYLQKRTAKKSSIWETETIQSLIK